MVKRNVQMPKPEEAPVKRQRTLKPKVKMDQLRDVVVDGKLVANIGDKVYFERIAPKGKMAIHEGVIKGVSDKGVVEIWDETAGQFYGFSLYQPIPVVKML